MPHPRDDVISPSMRQREEEERWPHASQNFGKTRPKTFLLTFPLDYSADKLHMKRILVQPQIFVRA